MPNPESRAPGESKKSEKQFHENIRRALINNGVNIDEIKKLVKRRLKINDILNQGLTREKDPVKFQKIGDEDTDGRVRMQILFLPAIYDLIDSGYTKIELSK